MDELQRDYDIWNARKQLAKIHKTFKSSIGMTFVKLIHPIKPMKFF